MTQKYNKICPFCRKSGFTVSYPSYSDGRPVFTCQGCNSDWTSGKTGDPYIGNEQDTR